MDKLGVNIFFDLDGTLTDPREGIVACIRHALTCLRQPSPDDAALALFIGPPLRDAFRELLPADHGDDAIEAAVTAYRDRFSTVGIFENGVFDGIPDVLENLSRRGARLFVVTSKPHVFATQVLEHFGLATHFAAVYGSELDGARSDKGELIAHALKKEGLNAADTVMVGDRRHDVVGALTNGVRPAGVLWGYGSADELAGAGARWLFRAPSDMLQLMS